MHAPLIHRVVGIISNDYLFRIIVDNIRRIGVIVFHRSHLARLLYFNVRKLRSLMLLLFGKQKKNPPRVRRKKKKKNECGCLPTDRWRGGWGWGGVVEKKLKKPNDKYLFTRTVAGATGFRTVCLYNKRVTRTR